MRSSVTPGPEGEWRPRVLVTCGTFEPGFRGGGPIRSVAQIIDSAPRTMDVMLLTSDRDLGMARAYEGLSGKMTWRGCTRIFYMNKHHPLHWFRVVREVRKQRPDLLYLNSLWDPWFSLLPILLSALGLLPFKTILLAPRGALSAGALELKAGKKRLTLPAIRRLLRGRRVLWHATSDPEAQDIVRAVPEAEPTLIIVPPSIQHFRLDPPRPMKQSGPMKFVFISRISPKKGLDTALEALSRLSVDAILDIYGPIEDTTFWARCLGLMASLPERVQATYRGEIQPSDVGYVLAEHDLFVFPTRGENFGHVIVESLAAGCPVLCTSLTPWNAVLARGGGEVVGDMSPAAWAEALSRWAAKSPREVRDASDDARSAFLEWASRQDGRNVLEVALRKDSGVLPQI